MKRPSNRATPSVPCSHSEKVRRQVVPDFAHSCGPLWKSFDGALPPGAAVAGSLRRWGRAPCTHLSDGHMEREDWWTWRDHLDHVQDPTSRH